MSGVVSGPSRVGRYRLLEEIGRGAMGRVYRAEDSRGQLVAVKVAGSAAKEGTARERFVNESLLALKHPNLVHVLDCGSEAGTPYLVYNLLEGETVQEILTRGPMEASEVIAMGTQLCAGLAALHAAGVVHRDVKAGNVIRSPEGHYTLIDFGLALWSSQTTRMTIQGQVLGTPAYLSPEQARGEIDIDGRADLWSLGNLLYEAASGVLPFDRQGAPLATMLAVIVDEPVPLADIAAGTSGALNAAVMKALCKSRAERWNDADAFAIGLSAQVSQPELVAGGELSESERRLVVVLLAEELFDAPALGTAIGERGGLFIQLGNDRAVGIFGGTASQGDELIRATEVGLSSLRTAARIAVASGHAIGRRSVVSGATLASAQAACQLDLPGVSVDVSSARALAGLYQVEARLGGHMVREARDASGFQQFLIGRDLELAKVLREIELIVEERVPGLVLVSGPRGIGKSSLLRSVEGRLRDLSGEAVILRGRAGASECDTALSVASKLLRTQFLEALSGPNSSDPSQLDAEAIEAMLGGLDSEERWLCADFLAELIGAPTRESLQIQAARADPQLRKDQIHFAVRSYFRGLASERPVILLIDDIQWCDAASLEVFAEIVDANQGYPIALVAAALPENEERYSQLFEERQHAQIVLRSLSRLQVAKLAEAIACQPLPEAATDALARLTDGNPLFVEHLVRDMYANTGNVSELSSMPLPPTVEAAVQSHLDNLGAGVKELCKRASVFTSSFSAAELWATGVSEDEDALDWLVHQGVLSIDTNTSSRELCYVFRSTLVTEVAYGMLLQEQRRWMHLRVAEMLSERRPEASEDIARHFSLGAQVEEAASWHWRAAQQAAQRGDSDTVLRCSGLSLVQAPGVRDFALHMLRCDAFRFLGWREEQADELEAALEAASSTSESARAMTEFAWNLSRTGNVSRALQMAEAAVDAGRDAGDRECLSLALGWRAVALAQLGRLDDALDALGEATQTAQGVSARVEALAADWRAQIYGARGDLAQRLRAFADAEAQYTAVGDVRRAAGAACNLADLYNRVGDFERAEKELREARAGCRRVNNRLVEGYASANLGYALMRQGRIDEATVELDLALALARETSETVLRIVVGIYRCRAELGAQPPEAVLAAAQAVAREAGESGLAPLEAMALAVASEAALLLGDLPRALGIAREAMSIRDRLGGLEEEEAELYLALARAQEACGDGQAAAQTRARGRDRILGIAEGIADEGLRHSFLRIGVHAELLA